MGWLLQAKLSVTSHKHQRVGHHSIHLFEQTWERTHNKNAVTKEATRKSIGVWVKMNYDESTIVHCCTILLFYKWCLTTATKVRLSGPVMANKKVKTYSKSHCILNWSWDLVGKPPFVILLRATVARESWHDFYLRKKGPAGARVSERYTEPCIAHGNLWDVAVIRNQGPLTDRFCSIWKTHFPDTEHQHSEGIHS